MSLPFEPRSTAGVNGTAIAPSRAGRNVLVPVVSGGEVPCWVSEGTMNAP